MPWPVFSLEPTDQVRVALRRFANEDAGLCPGAQGERRPHGASTIIAVQPARFGAGSGYCHMLLAQEQPADDDPRWPAFCGCGRAFAATDPRYLDQDLLYQRSVGGPPITLRDAGVGAMWDAWWMADDDGRDRGYTGPDGISLCVKTPGGDWMVDSQASNCTRDQWQPAGTAAHPNARRFVRSHDCWVRHGDPRQPGQRARRQEGRDLRRRRGAASRPDGTTASCTTDS